MEFSESKYVELSKTRYLALSSFFGCLANGRIPYAVIKGEPLSLSAYGKPGQRYSGDIDILVSRKDISAVKDALLSIGFEAENSNRTHQIIALSSTHQSVPFVKEVDGADVEIDVNHDIFWGEYTGNRLNIAEFLSDAIELEIYGCKVKALPPGKAMIQLALHHYNEFNSLYHLAMDYPFPRRMFKDVYCLWKNNKDVISLDLYKMSQAYGIIPYVYYVLYYTNRVFNDTSLEVMLKQFVTPEGKELIKCYGLTDNERKVWKIDFFERLERENVFDLIKSDLTAEDLEKIKRAQEIFG